VTVAVDHVAETDHGAEAEYAEEYAEAEGYEHDEYGYGHESEETDDAAALKRRNGAKLAVAVLGLAVFGTAAAFGYRAVFKGGVTGPPPVIHAEASPTKVFPADANAKPIGERLSSGGTERVVRRDEDPVDLRDPARTGAIVPGTGGPVTVAPMVPNASPAGSAPQSGSPPALTEPKRVRTVTIRADQPSVAPDRGVAPPPPRASAPAPRQVSPAAPPPSSAPLPLTPQVVATAEPPPASPAPVRPPPPPAAHAADGSGNGYVVQLSAQKSEAEAQASLRAAQAKYSALSGQPPLIRRKDQGERGIFYAAQVGPFGSRDQATQLCESLKSAGGSCFVAKN
jgi:cell division protein FtsN